MSADHRITLVLERVGTIRYLGHRDVAQALSRALRRSGLPLEMTQGFHPHVRMVLPEPLPLGVASDAERYVVHLQEHRELEEVQRALESSLPGGCRLKEVLHGAHRDALDAPVLLELEFDEPFDRDFGSFAEELGLASIEFRWQGRSLWLTVSAGPGRRPSISKVLRKLAQEGRRPTLATRRSLATPAGDREVLGGRAASACGARAAESPPTRDCTGSNSP